MSSTVLNEITSKTDKQLAEHYSFLYFLSDKHFSNTHYDVVTLIWMHVTMTCWRHVCILSEINLNSSS